MSGAVTAVTGAGKEIRVEGRAAALLWVRRPGERRRAGRAAA